MTFSYSKEQEKFCNHLEKIIKAQNFNGHICLFLDQNNTQALLRHRITSPKNLFSFAQCLVLMFTGIFEREFPDCDPQLCILDLFLIEMFHKKLPTPVLTRMSKMFFSALDKAIETQKEKTTNGNV